VHHTTNSFISKYFTALITFAMASKHTNNRTSGASLHGREIAFVSGLSIKLEDH
jgi:hypothetical protein